MKLYNSKTNTIEEFVPMNPPNVGMYACGMTVYDYAHIGHGRKYVGDDVLRRTLELFGYKVNHVQNVTDVGHLSSDADEGEDKLEKGAKKHGKTVWEVAKFFEANFYESMDKLKVLRPTQITRATEHVDEQISLVQRLLENGYAYETPEAVYFDVQKFEGYGEVFGGQRLSDKKTAVRQSVQTGEHKKHDADFALWFKCVGRFENHTMHWESPWGDGFPGWHIECSAMSMKYLGEQFDIHTGGEDHKTVHHPNEIAQSEAASGKNPFVKYWVHHAFLKVDGQKMSKSLNNFITIDDVVEKGYDPLSLRYLYLTTHYRDPMNFTWEALDGAHTALRKARNMVHDLKKEHRRTVLSDEKLEKVDMFRRQFVEALSDDLSTPKAIAVLWTVLKSNIPSSDKVDLVEEFDQVFALELITAEIMIPAEVKQLAEERERLRKSGDYKAADTIRDEIHKKGYSVEDGPAGIKIVPTRRNT